ncbi:MAG: hypothetical protein DWQ01_22385 [Planctomycetota bacterium]|nr:MAG: hypothetical protein DWQ01_22385 [Planctomycetota bacterium]
MIGRTLLAFACLAPLAIAQTPVSGKLIPVGGPTICQQGETHLLECVPGLYLKSSSIDLTRWENQIVSITGNEIGVTCRVWDVTSIQAANVTLEWSGNPVLGGSIQFDLCLPNVGGSYQLFAAKDYGFSPQPPMGTYLLGSPTLLVASGNAMPCDSFARTIPNNPAFQGQRVYLQALGTHMMAEYSNAVCFTIQ